MKIKGLLTNAITAMALVLHGALAADIPEVANPSTISGTITSAKFFGGATVDEGINYGTEFTADDVLDIVAEVHVEPGHVNSTGNLYVVASDGINLFQQLEDGTFDLWDGEVATLVPRAGGILLSEVNSLTVVDNLAFGQIDTTAADIYVYFAYDTLQNPGELYYSGEPVTLHIVDPGPHVDTFQLFQQTISQPVIQEKCIVCHVTGGLAEPSGLVYLPGAEPGYLENNFEMLSDYVLNAPGGDQLILSKPQGITHGGGVVLASGSSGLADLASWVDAVLAGAGSGGTIAALFEGVEMLDKAATLRKASLLFAGRLPMEAELAAVQNGTEDELRLTIRNLMEGDGFNQFLMEGANDKLLTRAFRLNLFNIVDRFYYPNSKQYFQSGRELAADRRLTSEALADEPLRLVSHVVMNERPYTEILTADYIMVNPYSADIYGGDVQFDNPMDPDEWREGEITEYYRCTICARNELFAQYDIPTDYPHAGILNSPAFLARFPSTSTNRNRARARWAYYFFLGVDIEGLSERTTDPGALSDEDNPTLNNPNCTVCHDIMDPVAGAFQNYGDDGQYRDKVMGLDSLPRSYKNDPESLYQIGDTWYFDMLTPGFGQDIAPDASNSLQWLAQQFVNDSRFGTGTVKFWYQTVFGREPLTKPANPKDFGYQAQLAAWGAEQEFIQQVSADFVIGVRGNGEHNLKDLLADLVMSDYFRATSSVALTETQGLQLEDTGTGRLLTPEQLNRKLLDVTGYEWTYGRFNNLTEVYDLVYGGIDSFNITDRATDLTTMMSTVVVTMANETSCAMVAQDFGRPIEQRYLFPHVQLDDLPTTSEAAIRANIQHLHDRMLGEILTSNDAEIDATYELFVATWQARVAAEKGSNISSTSELCLLEFTENPVIVDPNQTLRSWAAVLNYLLRDYRFIHE